MKKDTKIIWTGRRFELSSHKCRAAIETLETIATLENVEMSVVTSHEVGGLIMLVTLSGSSEAVSRLSRIIQQ